ncbi:MAG TPA: SIMPL domain-containing protein [Acidimicrobiales bacterium]|nr:SIMPL domain-containing protein [Acidimicrobiales bacterium]
MHARARWVAAAAVLAGGGVGAGALSVAGSARGTAAGAPASAGGQKTGPQTGKVNQVALASVSTKLTPLVCSKAASTVTVQGTGTSSAVPDQMTLTVNVHTQAGSAQSALAKNATKAQALITSIEHKGVPSRDLQTSGISLQPSYDNSGNITGYQVDDTVTVTVNGLAKAGSIIDAAVSAAGNSAQVQGVTFSVQHQDVVLALARAAAVRQAASLATQMAGADGLALGPLCSLQDQSSAPTPQPEMLFRAAGTASTAPSTPVQPGTEQFQAQVTATYELEQ